MSYIPSGLVILMILSLISPTHPARAAMSCKQAVEQLLLCQPFLLGVGEISSPCCVGVQALAQATTLGRKSICQCLEHFAFSGNINQIQDKANHLPHLCKTNLGILCDAIPSSDSGDNRYKNLELKSFRATTPGNSPGMGHKVPTSPKGHLLELKGFRPTTPGNSPGIGHKVPPSPKGHLN